MRPCRPLVMKAMTALRFPKTERGIIGSVALILYTVKTASPATPRQSGARVCQLVQEYIIPPQVSGIRNEERDEMKSVVPM
jgi:hypothetical protein